MRSYPAGTIEYVARLDGSIVYSTDAQVGLFLNLPTPFDGDHIKVSEIHLAPFTAAHMDSAVALSRQAGWPHRTEDWAMLAQLSIGFVALDGDRVVGTAFCTPFGPQVATLNMIIVDEAMRGRGLGRQLMQAVMQAAGARQMRLVATKDGLPLYEKLGFVKTGEIVQHQGIIKLSATQSDVSWAMPEDRPEIVALDRAANGLDRSALFESLFAQGCVAVIREAGQLAGFAVCRDFGRGKVIGPVVAQDANTAQTLIRFHLEEQSETDTLMRVDTAVESGLPAWLADLGLPHVDGGIVMQHGADHDDLPTDLDFHIFALTNQALG